MTTATRPRLQRTNPEGPAAVVYHTGPHRGPVHPVYGDINIGATAALHGMSTSHLAKILSGKRRPSLALMPAVCTILGKPAAEVMAMYTRLDKPKPTKPKRNKKQKQN